MEGITDAYMQAKRVCKNFEIKMLILIIMIFILKVIFSKTDVFKNFRKMCLKKISFRFCKIPFSSWISMESSFKKTLE